MREILIAGNPNVGKSTLFNSITKSSVHTGNFHGVTVEENSKIINTKNGQIKFTDLPGIYSLNCVSSEEEISQKRLMENNAEVVIVIDRLSIRKNLYLCQQLNELGINYKILINNLKKSKKNQNININLLKNKLDIDIFLIDAKKIKLNDKILEKNTKNNKKSYKYLEKYINYAKNKYNLDERTIIFALNGVFLNLNEEQISFFKSLYEDIIIDRYKYIDKVIVDCVEIENTFVYGKSKLDKFLLNPFASILGFLLTFFLSFYLIFFLIGPKISYLEEIILNFVLVEPIMNFLILITDNIWLIEFIRNGVLNSFISVITFIPQVTLIFIFLTIMEDSGIISRLAYVFDDFLTLFGLNGKALYMMLMGFGCNTMSTTLTRNLNDKNLKVKSAIINPYMSCMARLPVYSIIVAAFFSKISFLVIAGLYFLGIVVALIMSLILNKTILKSESKELLIEFPPLRFIDIKHTFVSAMVNAKDFFKRVFTIILSMGVIIWILTHTKFNLTYTQNISNSILFTALEFVSFLFAPIGLNNAGLVTALFVGVLAKELIVSTIAICNNTTSQKMLILSLISSTSVINFTFPSAVSFLIFSLLYSPCISNLAVIKKEIGTFYMWFSLLTQLVIAYILCFIVYNALTKGIMFALCVMLVITIIVFSVIIIIKKAKQDKCLACGKCRIK